MSDLDNNPSQHPEIPGAKRDPETSPPAQPSISDLILEKSSTDQPSFAPTYEASHTVTAPPAEAYANLPPDLRVPWRWTDIFLFILISAAAALLLVFGSGLIYMLLGHDPRQLTNTSPDAGLLSVAIQAVLDLGMLVFLLAQMRLRFRLPAWGGLGYHPLPGGTLPPALGYAGLVLTGVALSIGISVAGRLFPPKTELPVEQILHDHRTAILYMLMAVLVAPIVEETIFRGYLYPVAARSFGVPGGIAFTGLLFGLLHASQLSGGTWFIVLMVAVGCILTWIRAKTGTVLASFIVHTAYNGFQVVGLLIVTHGLTLPIPST